MTQPHIAAFFMPKPKAHTYEGQVFTCPYDQEYEDAMREVMDDPIPDPQHSPRALKLRDADHQIVPGCYRTIPKNAE